MAIAPLLLVAPFLLLLLLLVPRFSRLLAFGWILLLVGATFWLLPQEIVKELTRFCSELVAPLVARLLLLLRVATKKVATISNT